MNFTEFTIRFIEYDGTPSTRPPIFEHHGATLLTQIQDYQSLQTHEQDGDLTFLMVIPEGQAQPLGMAFMLFWLGAQGGFEWVSKYRTSGGLFDEQGEAVALDADGYISFTLRKGDRWAFWPLPSTH